MRIKAKPGYNVHLNDINLSLQDGGKFIYIDDEVFKSSTDAQKLMPMIEIENNEVKANETTVVSDSVLEIKQVMPNTFVMAESAETKQSGSIVFDPNNEADLNHVMTPNSVKQKNEIAQNSSTKQEKVEVKLDEIKIEVTSEPEKTEAKKAEAIKAEQPKPEKAPATEKAAETVTEKATETVTTKTTTETAEKVEATNTETKSGKKKKK